jgi:hypothetical protein
MGASCLTLPASAGGVCGNGVLEPGAGELCDGEANCIPPGESEECSFSCADELCPDGFICGDDDVCRLPGYEFGDAQQLSSARAVWVDSRDLTGDGKPELAWIESEAGKLTGTLHVASFDRNGEQSHWTWSGLQAPPVFGDSDEDGLEDIVIRSGDVNWSWIASGTAPSNHFS